MLVEATYLAVGPCPDPRNRILLHNLETHQFLINNSTAFMEAIHRKDS